MTISDEQVKLLAAALYEIRLLLSKYLGSGSDEDVCVRLAAHLAYALHEQADKLIRDDAAFHVDEVVLRIAKAERMIGGRYADNHGLLSRHD